MEYTVSQFILQQGTEMGERRDRQEYLLQNIWDQAGNSICEGCICWLPFSA